MKCLLYAKLEGLDVLISGSADRTIKLWDINMVTGSENTFMHEFVVY